MGKPQPDAVKFESSQREGRTQSQEFHQTVAHKSVPEEPRTLSSSQQPRNTETSFHQTETHRAEPDRAGPGSRTGKSISSLGKISANTGSDKAVFDPTPVLDEEREKSQFIEAFQPITGAAFAPVPETLEKKKTPKLFGRGIVRGEV